MWNATKKLLGIRSHPDVDSNVRNVVKDIIVEAKDLIDSHGEDVPADAVAQLRKHMGQNALSFARILVNEGDMYARATTEQMVVDISIFTNESDYALGSWEQTFAQQALLSAFATQVMTHIPSPYRESMGRLLLRVVHDIPTQKHVTLTQETIKERLALC